MTVQPEIIVQEQMITGYQYGANGAFIGVYIFHKNLDKEEIHMPPNTTLIEPLVVTIGKEAFWNGTKWDIRDETII